MSCLLLMLLGIGGYFITAGVLMFACAISGVTFSWMFAFVIYFIILMLKIIF